MPRPPEHTFHVTVSLAPGEPVVLNDEHLALQFAIVGRADIRKLDAAWQAPGVYLLIRHVSPSTEEGAPAWNMYVGQAKRLAERLKPHVSGDKDWETAILVRRTTTLGFNTAHISWLESHLCGIWGTRPYVRLTNKNTPTGDEAIPSTDHRLMSESLERIEMVLALRGVQPVGQLGMVREAPSILPFNMAEDTADGQGFATPSLSANSAHERGPAKVALLIEAGTIPVGTEFRLLPDTQYPVADRRAVRAWIEGNPTRGLATWEPSHGLDVLKWRVDGVVRTASGLADHILKEACGHGAPLRGTAMWVSPEGKTLEALANELGT